MRKPRILIVSDFHLIGTGYARMSYEYLRRWHATGKYELAELACGADPIYDAQRLQQVPWLVIPNSPNRNNQQEVEAYRHNQHGNGSWKFEQTCIHFQPDIIVAIRDPFFDNFIVDSIFRPFYYLIQNPPCDAEPLHEEWLDLYSRSDIVCPYTKYGYNLLKRQCSYNINLGNPIHLAADMNVFKPAQNRGKLRSVYGLQEDIILIGMVSRNQKRKLFSNLFEAFRLFLNKSPQHITEKAYLYLHTSYPDLMGWHFPELLKEFGLSSRVLFNYKCRGCNFIEPTFFKDGRAFCQRCHQPLEFVASARETFSNIQLCDTYNMMDCYVQYACAAGFELGVVEAGYCGVPSFVVDYSGMEDFKNTIGSIPIKVQNLWKEIETGRYFAIPDNADFVNKILNYLQLPQLLRNKKQLETVNRSRQVYSWDKSAQQFMNIFDKVELRDHKTTWLSSPRIYNSINQIPSNLSPSDLVNWSLTYVMGRPDLVNSYLAMKIIKDLNNGFIQGGDGPINFSCNEMLNFMTNKRSEYNYWEQQRWEQLSKSQQ